MGILFRQWNKSKKVLRLVLLAFFLNWKNFGFFSYFQRSCYHTMPIKRLSSLYSSLLFKVIDAWCMMMQKMHFGEYTLNFFWNWKNSSNTAIGITLSEPIIDDNLEVDVPEIFLTLKKFPLIVYLKPSGRTEYFESPTLNHITTMKPRTYGLPITNIASTLCLNSLGVMGSGWNKKTSACTFLVGT